MTVSHGRAGSPFASTTRIVELGVVGLPDGIRALGLAAVDELEAIAVGRRALVGQGEKPRVERRDDGVHEWQDERHGFLTPLEAREHLLRQVAVA